MTTRSSAFGIEGLCFSPGGFARRSIGVESGRIAAGARGPTWRLAPDEFLLPAFHDHHTHMVGSFRPPRGPVLDRCLSREECLERVAAWLRENPGRGPVLGEGWDESAWEDRRPPTRSELDRIAPERPVALRRVCGHIAVVNRAAWTALTPSGDEAEEASGRLTESLAMGIHLRWPATTDEEEIGASRAQQAAARNGVAAVDEMGRIETYQAFRRLEERGELSLHVDHYFPIAQVEELITCGLTPEAASGPLRIIGLKGFLDGSIGGRTAAVADSYRDTPSAGALLWHEDPLADLIRTGLRCGYSIALHAIGSRAIRQALDLFERHGGGRRPGTLLRIEHAEDLDDQDIARAGALGVTLSMQPNFTARWQGPGGMYEDALGPSRGARLNRFASVARAARLLFGSDTMPFGPLYGLVGALDHPIESERLGGLAALRAYMVGGIGPQPEPDLLCEGAAASLAVLRAPGGDLIGAIRSGTAAVIWTAIDGRVVHCDPSCGACDGIRGVS